MAIGGRDRKGERRDEGDWTTESTGAKSEELFATQSVMSFVLLLLFRFITIRIYVT